MPKIVQKPFIKDTTYAMLCIYMNVNDYCMVMWYVICDGDLWHFVEC